MRVSDTQTAELTKIAEGVYRDVNIAIANELYRVCDEYGVDFWEMRQAANHEFCNIHEAGLGVGGHCIPVYPQFIIQDFKKKGLKAPLASASRAVNDGMAEYFFRKVKAAVKKKAKVAVIGLTFREGVDELFYTRSRPLVKMLKAAKMDVYGVDPMMADEAIEREFKIKPHKGDDFTGFDAAILVNKDKRYVPALKAAGIPVIDCKDQMK
jgi:UDP-N-acetyl-D-mannosaminuronic acid dehydrogenase